MLKTIHALAGSLALLLSLVLSFRGATSVFADPQAISLLFIGLLNIQLVPSLQTAGPIRPLLMGASTLLLLAAAIAASALLLPTPAGQPTMLASLLLVFVGVALHLATTQRKPATEAMERKPRQRRRVAQTPASGSIEASGRETGTVKWFNTSKGFGFICRDTGEDVFVHFRAIRGEGHRFLAEGQRVEFSVSKRERGLQADDVVPLPA
ncbi:cold-shock protein [Stutzerimonas tarimensis]|uniref:Cold shock domain-containing protein membrane protein n=1 Tax=Stutzerimonas tarimensis TaxID=1507735 RepID=A0ABV7T8F5_9GAMM